MRKVVKVMLCTLLLVSISMAGWVEGTHIDETGQSYGLAMLESGIMVNVPYAVAAGDTSVFFIDPSTSTIVAEKYLFTNTATSTVDTVVATGGSAVSAWYDTENSKQYIAVTSTATLYWLEVKDDYSLEGVAITDEVTSFFGRGGVEVSSDGFIYCQGLFGGIVVYDALDLSGQYAAFPDAGSGVTRKLSVSLDGNTIMVPCAGSFLLVYPINEDRDQLGDADTVRLVTGLPVQMASVDHLDRVWTASRVPDGNGTIYAYDFSGETPVIVDSIYYKTDDSTVVISSPRDIEFLLNENGDIVKAFISDYDFHHITVMEKTATGIWEYAGTIAQEFKLENNYPNPFNPSTTIPFSIEKTSVVKLTVYNTLGQKMQTLVSSKLNAGAYSYNFNATNFATGTYFYRLEVNGQVAVRKMLFLK